MISMIKIKDPKPLKLTSETAFRPAVRPAVCRRSYFSANNCYNPKLHDIIYSMCQGRTIPKLRDNLVDQL